ncbi:Detected protein of unknown function [Hibiscus syriacus]|uniref:Uncharacterized protein n=1 Tax=Hibiscus syriacus TaxID=106335 RepID=A0A6A2XX76_HIBSY|nr:Detected protein of unknown function [Hibiscus syriacus]
MHIDSLIAPISCVGRASSFSLLFCFDIIFVIRQAWSPHIDISGSHLLVLSASQSQLFQSEYEDYVAATSSSLACLRLVAPILLIILLLRQVLMLTRDSGMIQESSTLINHGHRGRRFCFSNLMAFFFHAMWRLARGIYKVEGGDRVKAAAGKDVGLLDKHVVWFL